MRLYCCLVLYHYHRKTTHQHLTFHFPLIADGSWFLPQKSSQLHLPYPSIFNHKLLLLHLWLINVCTLSDWLSFMETGGRNETPFLGFRFVSKFLLCVVSGTLTACFAFGNFFYNILASSIPSFDCWGSDLFRIFGLP